MSTTRFPLSAEARSALSMTSLYFAIGGAFGFIWLSLTLSHLKATTATIGA